MDTDGSTDGESIQFSLLAFEADELRQAGLSCLLNGDLPDAEALFRAGTLKHPLDFDFRFRLASALLAQGKMDEALLCLADARSLFAEQLIEKALGEKAGMALSADELRQLAQRFYANEQVTAAACLFQQAVDKNADDLGTTSSLALALMHQGRLEESTAAFQSVVRRMGASPAVHSFLHYARVFQQEGPHTLYEEGQRWSQLCEGQVRRRSPKPPRTRGRLKVGYFSPTFNGHQLAHFFLPALQAHDRERFEIICLSHAEPADEVGKAVVAAADIFRNVKSLSDDDLCDQIGRREIDVLVDLWGHNAGNRLMAFARKPSPIQVSWLNYINTTGLTAFDAVLHADGYRFAGDQQWYSEPIRSIGPVIAPFRPLHGSPPAGPTPALASERFTFFCAAHPAKINLNVVRTWARILREAPNAVIELRYSYFKDAVLRRSIVAMFESCGVTGERIVFPPHETGAAFRASLQKADVVLDPFPYQGMTTSLDALAAGVPVLAYEGDYLALRIAASALRVCGLEELIAADLDEYVAKAVALAADPKATDALRARVRPGFEASAFRDEVGFTRRLEAVYLDLVANYAGA